MLIGNPMILRELPLERVHEALNLIINRHGVKTGEE
jgi:hypothetical protein